MKKTAILLILCVAALVGCGQDPVEPAPMQPIELETSSEDEVSDIIENPEYSQINEKPVPQLTGSANHKKNPSATTTRTGSVNLVKRSGAATAAVVTGSPNRSTASIPKNSSPSAAPPSKTTSAKKPKSTTTTKASSTKNSAGLSSTTASTCASTTTTAVTTTPPVHYPDVATNDGMTFNISAGVIEVIRNETIIQSIAYNSEQLLNFFENGDLNPANYVYISDFDFDGHDDIFIPSNIGNFNTEGVYYRYDTESDTFINWDDMSELKLYAVPDKEKSTICITDKKSQIEFTESTYEWDGDKLKPKRKEEQYLISDTDRVCHLDTYEYHDDEEKLVKREKLTYDDANNLISREDVALEEPAE